MRSCAFVVGVVASGCSFGLPGPAGGPTPDGTGAPDVAPPGDAAALGPWGTPTLVLNEVGDDDPTLTADLLELYFNRGGDIYVATRVTADVPFGTPKIVAELSTAAGETTPEITGDGLTIFVASARSGGFGADDVWMFTRSSRSQPFTNPTQMVSLSTAGEDAASAPTDDLLALVLVRNSATEPYDLFASSRRTTDVPWSVPVPITELNSAMSEASPFLSADKLTLYFDSNRGGTNDLYIATRTAPDAPFGAPHLISELATTAADADPWVSPDQRHLFFVRENQIYEATR
jgi:hypothetical protein